MILDVDIGLVVVTAVLVLAVHVVAYYVAFFYLPFVEDFGVHMKKAPIFKRKMRYWITAMSHATFEVTRSSVLLVEPNSELCVSDTRTSIVVKISDLVLVRKQIRRYVSGYGSS